MSRFWSRAMFTATLFDNTVSQARDLLAAERNFMSAIRTAFTVTVAATAIVFHPGVVQALKWEDWVLVALLLSIAFAMPNMALFNYASQFDAHQRDEAEIHNSAWLLVSLVLTGVCAILVAIREYYLGV